ncbi:MAG: response regulator transcription factor [Peptostreptococcaceae bacterium]
MNIKIGLVEDEKNLNDIMKSYLEREGYSVYAFENGEDAKHILNNDIHIWVLDIMLPGKCGFELMDDIKKINPKTPIILISARDQDFDKILGLEKGAEDYITKPFSPKELVLRVKKILDRCYQQDDSVELAGYKIDLSTHKVYDNEILLDLSNREYMLLVLMYKNIGRPFTRDEILNNIWEPNYFGSDRVVDDLMRRLRKKMPRLKVETIYRYGYRMEI